MSLRRGDAIGSEALQRIGFASEREQALFAQARFGETVRSFLSSDVGRYLHGCAEQRVNEIKDDLLTLELEDPACLTRFRALQNEAYAAQHTLLWLAEALQNAEVATQQLESEDRL